MLWGRRAETEVLEGLLGAARAGRGGVLVLRGEAGIGKTALLDHGAERATGVRVLRAAGVESEARLAYAGLQHLCAPLADSFERLPPSQRDALATAFGLRAGAVPERSLVGLAALSLLAGAARREPLACLVDDAQWLDRESAQALALIARRLAAEPVALVLATRTHDLAGLPELEVRGLAEADARALLESRLLAPLDEQVRGRIVAEARGNPLALLALPRGASPAELAGGYGLALDGRGAPGLARRLDALPPDTRRLLVVAAAEPAGDPALVWGAAARLGIGRPEVAEPAVAAGLLAPGARVRFADSLARAAAYRAAPADERQAAHRALAEATDPESDPDRRAWQLALATTMPDETVAAALERAAKRAGARGGVPALAAFLERAAALTLDPARRAERALAAAAAKFRAGAPDTALQLLSTAEAGPLDAPGRARADALRARLERALRGAMARSAADAALCRWDEAAWQRLAERRVRRARETGALAVLPAALGTLAGVHLGTGDFAAAEALLEEAEAVAAATRMPRVPVTELSLAALRGREDELTRLAQALPGDGLAVVQWARAVLANGSGRYQDAVAEEPEPPWSFPHGFAELVEAGARAGDASRAQAALERLVTTTRDRGTDWARGVEARSRALLGEGDDAERLYREALEHLGRTAMRVDLARAHLVYGEWLRRERRRVDARRHLQLAGDLCTRIGLDAFAERARRELRATGATARKRSPTTRDALTAQEAIVARLARAGLSNPEIGARLFISPHTVASHLHRVFAKLGISSRNQLAAALAADDGAQEVL